MDINFFSDDTSLNFNSEEISNVRHHLRETSQRDDVGFISELSNSKALKDSQKVYQKFSGRKKFFHIGIGGSSLGPEMLLSALKKRSNDINFTFINNIDPDEISDQISKIDDPKDSIFYIVSKSGGTSETIAAAIIIINTLTERFGISVEDLKEYIVLCTDPQNGDLREFSSSYDIETLEVPSNVGGRFSVLTPVGFLPALFANINISRVVDSAKRYAVDQIENQDDVIQTALTLDYLRCSKGITQTVLMPYSSKLKNFSSWFVQLWAESLGKKSNLKNQVVNVGYTPIQSYGATDQHSQMQLFVEGPIDKAMFLVSIENFSENIRLNNSVDLGAFQSLNNFSLNELMQAEFYGAKQTLIDQGRPLFHIKLDALDEKSLAEMIIFFELLTVAQGNLLSIDPFNQPGVESGKIYTKKWLSNQI